MSSSKDLIGKFTEWKALIWSNCVAKYSANPPFCLIDGSICHFIRCPRRIYLEVPNDLNETSAEATVLEVKTTQESNVQKNDGVH